MAIAHHIKEQVVFLNEPIIVNPRYGFNIERLLDQQDDIGGGEIVVI